MTPGKGTALIALLGRSASKGASSKDAAPDDAQGDGESYDADLRTALEDFASALGVTVKNPAKAVEAMKTIHDLCDRASGDGE